MTMIIENIFLKLFKKSSSSKILGTEEADTRKLFWHAMHLLTSFFWNYLQGNDKIKQVTLYWHCLLFRVVKYKCNIQSAYKYKDFAAQS